MASVKTAAIQLKVSSEKTINFDNLKKYLVEISKEKADLVILPEMFNCPYENRSFSKYAEEEGGPSWQKVSALAAQYGVYLAAGSMPERDAENRIYNTSYIFDREGRQIGKYRKIHLFDIDIRGGQTFKESETLSAGDQVNVFQTEFGAMGLCICYDIRFPEIFRLMADKGAKIIIVPGAFNMTTGPMHWELLFRTRAVDNQVFMIGAAPARDLNAGYLSWGHTIMTDPWGNVVTQMDENEGYVIQDLDLSLVEKVRQQLPLLCQRRNDVYRLKLIP